MLMSFAAETVKFVEIFIKRARLSGVYNNSDW